MNSRFAFSLAAVLSAFVIHARPVPRPALQSRIDAGIEIYGIVHWGLNTYTDREWGYGDENPEWLDPKEFNADQIVGACKAGGLQGLIVVAKHHDGFCLWPTATTGHNITKSPFRGGKGDYVGEMCAACRRQGLKFGVYCSPWDRNNADYGTPAYVKTFHNQIKELLDGRYGEIFEMWFDGANGGDGYYGGAREKRKIAPGYYRYREEVFNFVREMQPSACIFNESDLADFRFGGNERGLVDPDCRATCARYYDTTPWQEYKTWCNKGLFEGVAFHPVEGDFPLRKGWFYHEKDRGTAKPPLYLTKLYLGTVGNGATMNIGIAPDRRGLLDDEDVKALKGFGIIRNRLFEKEVTAANEPFNLLVMREDVRQGERIDGWEFLADGESVLAGFSIGMKRIRTFRTPVTAAKCELRVLKDCGSHGEVAFRRYYVDPELLAAVLDSTGDSGETDTARWMIKAAK